MLAIWSRNLAIWSPDRGTEPHGLRSAGSTHFWIGFNVESGGGFVGERRMGSTNHGDGEEGKLGTKNSGWFRISGEDVADHSVWTRRLGIGAIGWLISGVSCERRGGAAVEYG